MKRITFLAYGLKYWYRDFDEEEEKEEKDNVDESSPVAVATDCMCCVYQARCCCMLVYYQNLTKTLNRTNKKKAEKQMCVIFVESEIRLRGFLYYVSLTWHGWFIDKILLLFSSKKITFIWLIKWNYFRLFFYMG